MKIDDLNSELELMKESDVRFDQSAVSVAKKPMPEKTEILERRESHSKTFQKKKGNFETIFYNVPVHQYDEEERRFVENNEDVEENENAFETTKPDFAVAFHKQEDSKALFTMKRGNYQVCVSVKNQFGSHTKRPMPIWEQDHNQMHYANVSLDTDYDCSVTASGVKIAVMKRSNQNTRSTFVVACEGLRYVWDENDKVLRFIAEETDETVFEIPAPFMIDAYGACSDNVSLEIVSVNDHAFELSVVPDMGWLSAKEHAYPVSMEWSMISDTPVKNGFAFERKNISADGKIAIGGTPVTFKMYLPEQKSGVITKRVKALFHCDDVPVAEDKDYLLVLKRVTKSDIESEPVTRSIGVSTMSIGKTEYAFDVTSEYTADENTTYSLQLCEEQEGKLVATSDASVALMTLSAASAISTFSVEETDGTTEEDKSSGESGNIGSVGTYEVDLVSGKLNMEMKDFAWEGNRMPISISRSYKGQFASKSYGSWSSANGSFGSMLLGYGWRMNLMQSMVDTGLQKVGDAYKSTYTYTDESGEEFIFAQCECESGSATCTTYEDVDGLGYVYESATGVLTKGTEKHTFSSGRLVKIVDEFGNTMTINYTSGRITSVKDGVGRTFTFGYSGNYLVSITAPNGSSIQYQYNNEKLYSTTYPNGQTLTFAYDTVDKQPSSVTVSGSGIVDLTTKFEYFNKTVSEISTLANGAFAEKRTKFEIDPNGKQTIVTEIDGIDGASDQIKQHKVYFHEHSDKNYTYYEAGSENKTAVSGSNGVILPYTEPGMEIGNLTCKNLLKNHNFNRSGRSIDLTGWDTNLTGDHRGIQYDPPEKMPGYCAAYLLSLYSTDSQRGIWQTVNLAAGKSYVFSCYLKLDQANSNPNRGVYLMVKNANGDVVCRSKMISTKKEFQRVALPFTVDASCGLSYTVGIYIDGNVKAKAIAPQLEQGTTLSPYNYLSKDKTSYSITGSATCPYTKQVTVARVPAAKDARESFTLSGYAKGQMTYSTTNGHETYATLKAVIHYAKTKGESKESEETYWVPIYTDATTERFAMVQFSKEQYRAIDYIEIICENNYNPNTVTFSDLQLIRNTYVDGLTEEDFIGNTDDSVDTENEAEDSLLTSSSSDSDADDVETITFEEVLDAFGNALTGTNFKNGELGAIYTEQMFADSNPNDTIGDAGNNKTSEIDARGNETKYEYDPVTSKPTKVIDRCGNETNYTYDAAGRTTKVSAPNGGTVNYGYNSYDDLTSIMRGDGQSYTMGYDAYRNLTSVKVGSQNLVTYDYKSGGNRLKSMTYANGAVQNLTYDRFGNVIGEAWNGVMAYRYFYDASNQLVKTLDISNKKMYNINRVGENVTSIEEYDVASINATTYAVSGLTLVGTMHYSFDSNGKQFRKKYIDADGNEQKYVFEYQDEQNVAVQLPTGVVSHAKSDHLGRKVFDELQLGKGLMNRKFTYHAGKITEAHEANDKEVSDPQTTLVKQIEFADGRTIEYTYDKEERITKVVDSVDGTYEYTYDALGQLLTETVNGVKVNEMTYDKYGNIATKNGKTYTYDTVWRDKLLSTGDGSIGNYDDNGNPRSYLGNTLVWEKGRQLKQYGANTYKYNNEGIRIRKQTSTEIHEYILDGTNIVKEIVTDNYDCPKYTNEYLYDLDGTVCGIKHEGVAYYFYKNLQGDVIAITDDSGVTVARYAYDAWGKCTIVSDNSGVGIATINPFRYRSYYYDVEAKLYYLQSRYYDPAVGRFINADDVEVLFSASNTIGFNLYSYCDNDCVNEKDVSGNLLASKIAEVLLSALTSMLLQLGSDLITYLIKKYLCGRNVEFSPDPKDYILAAIDGALDCINPFCKGKKAKKIYAIVYPLIFVIVDHVWTYLSKKKFDPKQLGYDLIKVLIKGVIEFVLDRKKKNKINKIKKKIGKRTKAYKSKRISINAKFKALGRKIEVRVDIAEFISDILFDVIFA